MLKAFLVPELRAPLSFLLVQQERVQVREREQVLA